MAYITLDEVKSNLNIEGEDSDALIQNWIEVVTTWIDTYCGRVITPTTATTKYYNGSPSPLFIDDLITVTTFKLDEDGDGTYESTLATTDYLLMPLNGTPKMWVELSHDSDYGSFANGVRKGVEITGSWGYQATIPPTIRGAALIQVSRLFKRKDTAFATVIALPDMGQMEVNLKLDPDVKLLLSPYINISGSIA